VATLGLFDPEARQVALFDATVVEAGRFDPELVDAAAGGPATLTATASPSITLALAPSARVTLFTAQATPSITLALAPVALKIAVATATPSITLGLAPAAFVVAMAQASPSITLSLGPVALKIAVATATPSITLSLAPNASATLGATATPSITLSLAPVALKIGVATATPSITLSLGPVGVLVALAQATPSITLSLAPTAGGQVGTASPSITLSLAPVALKIAPTTATPSITLALAPVALTIGLAQAAPSVTLALAPSGLTIAPAQAAPSITLTLTPVVPSSTVVEAHTATPGTIIADSFDRADNAASLGTADGGQVWSALVGTWGISANRAVKVSAGTHTYAVLESGLSNVSIQSRLGPTDLLQTDTAGLMFRVQSAGNGLGCRLVLADQAIVLFKLVGGVFSQLASAAYSPSTATMVLRVACEGGTIRCYINDTLWINQAGVTDFQTATQHGLYAFGAVTTTWDDFSITGLVPTIRVALSAAAHRISTATVYTVYDRSNRQGLREVAIGHRGSR
jgi:hypothetical protein